MVLPKEESFLRASPFLSVFLRGSSSQHELAQVLLLGFEADDLESIERNLREAGFPMTIESKSDKDADYRVQDPDGRYVDIAVKLRWPK